MNVTIEHRDREMRVRFDPHDNTCRGAHDIVVVVMWVEMHAAEGVHITTAWQGSALLSIRGTREFAAALNIALDTADAMAEAENVAQADLIAKQYLRSFGIAVGRA